MPVLNKADREKASEYEHFVATSAHGHCLQSMNWAKVKANWESDYVYLDDESGHVRAALSLLSIKNDGVHSFIYAPRGPVCDLADLDTVNRLLAEAEPIIEDRKAFLLRLDPEIPYAASLVEKLTAGLKAEDVVIRTRGLPEHSFSNPRNNMVLYFRGRDFDQIMKDFSSKRRNQFRKTYKNGLTTRRVHRGDPDFEQAMQNFFALTEIMASRQQISHRPIDYFYRLFEAFPDVCFYETADREEVLSSSIVVTYNKKAFYMYAASSDKKRNLNASAQMNLEAIRDACQKPGVTEYDFGGVYEFDRTSGLYSFKADFTGDEGRAELLGEIDIIYDRTLYQDFL